MQNIKEEIRKILRVKLDQLEKLQLFLRQNSTTRPSLTKLVSFSPSSEGPDVVFTESSDK